MMDKVIGIGAGGHARVVAEAIRLSGEWEVVGFLDPAPSLRGTTVAGVDVLGGDELLSQLKGSGISAVFIGVGNPSGAGNVRQRLFEQALDVGLEVISVVHPSAIISPTAKMGRGAQVLAGAVVNVDVLIGDNAVLNTGAIAEHDCVIEKHVFVATGSKLGGNVRVGAGAFVGIGASILPGVSIGSSAVVGGAAMVVRDVDSAVTVIGVPARPRS